MMVRENALRHLRWLFGIFACAVVLLACMMPKPAFADGETVRVGYYENEVFEEGAQSGKVRTGYAYEYYRKLSEYTGWKYEYIYGSYGELYQKLLDGEIDLLAGLAKRDERIGRIGYPEAIMGEENYYLIKNVKNDGITADSATFQGKRIGVLDSAMLDVLQRYLAGRGIAAEIVTYDDYSTLFAAFDAGELDIAAAEGNGASEREQTEVLCPFGATEYYLCVNIHRPDLLEELNRAQEMLAAEEPNYYNSLRTKYYSRSVARQAYSAMEREWLASHDVLRVGYLDHYLPYSETDEKGEVTGLIRDIIPDIFNKLDIEGVAVSYHGYENFDAMIEDMGAGVIDVAFPVGAGLYYSEEKGIHQSYPVSISSKELVYAGEYTDEVTRHFAVNENNRLQYYYVKTYFPDAEISFYPSIDACLDAVRDGKAGCTILNGLRAFNIMKNSRYRDLSLYLLSNGDERCFGVKFGNEGLLKLLNRGISVIGKDYVQNRISRYADNLYVYTLTDFIREYLALFVAILLAGAVMVIAFLAHDARRAKAAMQEKESARLAIVEKNRQLEQSREELIGKNKIIEDALAAAENSDRAKSEFLAHMSHDIRTPMNAIIGFSTLLAKDAKDPEKVAYEANKILLSGNHLLALINDVLDMSRIDSGNVKLHAREFRLAETIAAADSMMRSQMEERHQSFDIHVSDIKHEVFFADDNRIQQVLINLLSNAMKYTDDGGKIEMRVRGLPAASSQYENIEFEIIDNGRGMSDEYQKILFTPFSREHLPQHKETQGTGLGLAITRNIVNMLGGNISVKSKLGEGSAFTVILPVKIVEAEAASRPAGHTEQEAAQDVLDGLNILASEDNAINAEILKAILQRNGATVTIVGNGKEALDEFRACKPGTYDVLFSDIQMPVMDGYESTKAIRALANDPSVSEEKREEAARMPIIAMTANAFNEDVQKSLLAGMNAHVSKPLDLEVLRKALRQVLPSGK